MCCRDKPKFFAILLCRPQGSEIFRRFFCFWLAAVVVVVEKSKGHDMVLSGIGSAGEVALGEAVFGELHDENKFATSADGVWARNEGFDGDSSPETDAPDVVEASSGFLSLLLPLPDVGVSVSSILCRRSIKKFFTLFIVLIILMRYH